MSVDAETRDGYNVEGDVNMGDSDDDGGDEDGYSLKLYKIYNESKSNPHFLQWLAQDVDAPKEVVKINNTLQAYERELVNRLIREEVDRKYMNGSKSFVFKEGMYVSSHCEPLLIFCR